MEEPREELALALDALWASEFDGSALPYVSGTRPLAASAAFYAPAHPNYWSLWNNSVETPWTDTADVHSQGGAIICDMQDDDCQLLAETWTADRRTVTVAKSARGHDFAPRSYLVYVVHPFEDNDGIAAALLDGTAR